MPTVYKGKLGIIVFIFIVILGHTVICQPAADPSNVVVGTISSGTIVQEKTFVGTVYYAEISEVSAEVSGAVKLVHVEEGQRVARGDHLVTLDSSMLRQALLARMAIHEQTLSDLKKASRDLERSQTLFDRNIIAEKDFDDHRFAVMSMEKRAASLKAEVDRLEIELDKTIIRAPFAGIVVKKATSPGEWVSPGRPVVTVAMDTVMDVIASVPEEVLAYLKPGMTVTVRAGGKKKEGTIRTIIPRGDIATRTFPVKIGVSNNSILMEGMEAQITLPSGKTRDVFLVHRDAVLNVGGETSIVTVANSTATIVPVSIVGYQGIQAAIEKHLLEEGMAIVVKGNERLRNGQAVNIIEELPNQ